MISSFFKLLSVSKKSVATASAASLGSVVTYLGIIKPSMLSSRSDYLVGSVPELKRNKGNPYRTHHQPFFVKDFSRNDFLPPLFPALTRDHLSKNSSKVDDFLPSMIPHLTATEIPQVLTDKFYYYDRNTATTLLSAASIRRVAHDFSILSDIEIPYKSYLLTNQVNNFSKSQIVKDLIWSLLEESESNGTVVRPKSIKVDFNMVDAAVDITKTSRRDFFPIPAKKIQNFEITARILNPKDEEQNVFRILKIGPRKEAEITVKLDESEIRPFAFASQLSLEKGSTWSLMPTGNNEFNVRIREVFPSTEEKYFSFPRLQLIHGASRFLGDSVSNYSGTIQGKAAINMPTYRDFLRIAQPLLVSITPDQIKKDLETWYGSFAAFNARSMILDIKKLLNMLNLKIIVDYKGRSLSAIESFIEDSDFRYSLYNHIRLNENLRAVLDPLFDKDGKDDKIDAKQMTGLLKSFSSKMEEMLSAMSIEFTWESEPVLAISEEDDGTPYPAISFKLKQKIKWDKKVTLPFKGCWDETNKSYQESTDSCSCTGTNKIKFDFSKKFDQIKTILQPVSHLITGSVAGIDIFNSLLPDAGNYVGWDKWEIEANDSIENTYEATRSPIRPTLTDPFDLRDRYKVVPGWKALDVSFSQNLSNFKNFFSKIYEKIVLKQSSDSKITNFSIFSITSITSNVKDEMKTKPLSTIIHLINMIFDEKYYQTISKSSSSSSSSSSNSDTQQQKKPWPVFFETLFKKDFKFDSVQLFAGFPRSFFEVKDFVLTKTKETKTKETKNEYKLDKDWLKKSINETSDETDIFNYPATPRTKELDHILQNMIYYFSLNFPKAPIIFEFSKTNKWKRFLNNEGATTTGFIRHIDKVKDILVENFHQRKHVEKSAEVTHFPNQKFVNWDKVKLSVVQLEIEAALRSVLNLTISSSLTSLLTLGSITVSNLLGDSIMRDFLFVSVNMMLEDGSVFLTDTPLRFAKKSAYSTYQFGVNINFDKSKLKLGSYIKL